MEEKEPIGFLFDEIPFYSPEDIDTIIDNLSEPQIKFLMIKSIQYAFKLGIFNFTESEILSKCLRHLNRNTTTQK
jgi:hypothetical protein